MLTAEECRRRAAELRELAANSPVLRDQYLKMAATWGELERQSAKAEGAPATDREA